jgi:peptide chain release factor 1
MMSEARADDGGYKMVVLEIQGDKVYSKLKFEVG